MAMARCGWSLSTWSALVKRLSLLVLTALAALVVVGCSSETNPATDIGLHHTDVVATLNGKVACNAGDSGYWYWRYSALTFRRDGTEQPTTWTRTPNQAYNCDSDVGPIPVQQPIDALMPETHYVFELCGTLNSVSPTSEWCVGDSGDVRSATSSWTAGVDDDFWTPPLVVQPLCCPPPPPPGEGTPPPPEGVNGWTFYEAKLTASGSGACVTGVARWFYRNSFGDLLWSIKMNQKTCLTSGGKHQAATTPTILVDVTTLGRSTGWAYDCSAGSGACGGGYKVLGDAGQTMISQTKRIVRFIRCLPFSGQTICFKTEKFPMRNIFASSPGFITVSSYPHND